jgi:hypothetical protein
MKFFITLAICCCVGFSFGQTPDKAITYTARALPLRAVVEALSKQTGVKLKAASELEEEPVILRLDHVPLKDVLDKLADVFAGDWVDHGDFKRLERSDEKIAAIRAALHQKKLVAIRDSIEAIKKRVEQAPALDQAHAEELVKSYMLLDQQYPQGGQNTDAAKKHMLLASQLPETRIGTKIVANMDPEELASIPDNERAVFSTAPNSMQHPLTGCDPADIKQFFADRKTLDAAVEKLKPKLEGEANKAWPFAGDLQNSNPGVVGDPARILVCVQNWGSQELAEVELLDAKGKHLIDDSEAVGMDWAKSLERRVKNAQLDKEIIKNGFELGPIAKELGERLHRASTDFRPLTANTSDLLMQPTVTDPLTFFTADTILRGAERQGLNAIALVPDEADFAAEWAAHLGKTSLDRYRSALGSYGASLTIADGWIVVKPDNPEKAAEDRLARDAMEAFVHRVVDEKVVTIEAAADLKVSVPRGASTDLAANYVKWLLNDTAATPLESWTGDGLRLYGTLNGQERQAAAGKDGLTASFSNLSADQQKMVYALYMNTYSWVNELPGKDGSYTGQSPEKTDLIPDGLTMNHQVTVTDKTDVSVFTLREVGNGNSYSSGETIDALAYPLLQKQHPELFPGWRDTSASGYRLGTQRTVTFTIKLGGGYELSDGVLESHESDGPMLSLDELVNKLPPDVKEKLDKEIAKVLDSVTKYRMSHPGITPTPTTDGVGAVQPPVRF